MNRLRWCVLGVALATAGSVAGQDAPAAVILPPVASVPEPATRALPINLPTALQLARVRAIDIQVAAERVNAASAQLDRARSRWLPTLYLGADYSWHNGRLQDVVGNIFPTSKRALMVGAGPSAVFSPSEAILAPLAARQVVAAREADRRATENDVSLSVAEAYFDVQRARGELAGALEAERLAVDLVRRAENLTLAQPVEANRARAELARRRQAVVTARERWETTAAELNRILRLPATAVVEPAEPPQLRIDLFEPSTPIDDLIPIALTNRPELAAQQALVSATLARLRQERLRPLVPSLVVRGNATNPGGTLASGRFGGGVDGEISNFGWRNSYDVQVLWELQGLGLGNWAAVREREAEKSVAVLELLRAQDRVAAEAVQAHAQATRAATRAKLAEEGLKEATETVKTNLEGLSQTRRVGETLVLVFRPQEAVAAVQALDQAYRDYFGAIAEANRAQFRLYRALGHPAQCVLAPTAAELPAPAARLAEPAPTGKTPKAPAAKLIPRASTDRQPGTDFAKDRPR